MNYHFELNGLMISIMINVNLIFSYFRHGSLSYDVHLYNDNKSFWNIDNDLSLNAPGTLVFSNLFQGGRRTILGLREIKLLTPSSTNESQGKHQEHLYFMFSFFLRIWKPIFRLEALLCLYDWLLSDSSRSFVKVNQLLLVCLFFELRRVRKFSTGMCKSIIH